MLRVAFNLPGGDGADPAAPQGRAHTNRAGDLYPLEGAYRCRRSSRRPLSRRRPPAHRGFLRCPSGDSFDIARQEYVSLLAGDAKPGTADSAEMVQARADFLGAGHYAPSGGDARRTLPRPGGRRRRGHRLLPERRPHRGRPGRGPRHLEVRRPARGSGSPEDRGGRRRPLAGPPCPDRSGDMRLNVFVPAGRRVPPGARAFRDARRRDSHDRAPGLGRTEPWASSPWMRRRSPGWPTPSATPSYSPSGRRWTCAVARTG